MTAQDRLRWDSIYQDQQVQRYPDPDPILFDFTPPVFPGQQHRAFDVAGGLGQNGLWLASQGYTVDIIDISRVALARARVEMAIRNLRNVNLLQVDLDELEPEEEQYDIVCMFRYLKRDFFKRLQSSIKPGGRVIYATYNVLYLDIVPRFNTQFLLNLGELTQIFKGWKIVYDQETDFVSQIVAIKPEKHIN